jgi:hypothetical protein
LLLVLTEVVFCAGQKAENDFAGLGKPFKRRFLDLAQVAFWVARMQKN